MRHSNVAFFKYKNYETIILYIIEYYNIFVEGCFYVIVLKFVYQMKWFCVEQGIWDNGCV